MEYRNLLTIAGSDSCGGAGVQADLKTFSAWGTYGMSVITAVTAQNTQGVFGVEDISPEMIGAQMDAIFTDITVDGVKIGMLSQTGAIDVIAQKLKQYKPKHIVLDPVMVSKSGCNLLQPDAVQALKQKMLPLAQLVTPNIPEAEVLTGMEIKESSIQEAARRIYAMGCQNVLIKGGHLEGDAVDTLYDGTRFVTLDSKRIPTKNTHGTGCTLSSAIAAALAKGMSMEQAVSAAKEYITNAIEHSIELGHGVGPVNHFYHLWRGLE